MTAHHPHKGQLEQRLLKDYNSIVGVDEVGRGCLAGPVFAACASLDYSKIKLLDEKSQGLIRDSKKLSHKQRLTARELIWQVAIECHVGSASVREIETLGIVGATFRAMRRALRLLSSAVDILILDGNQKLPRYGKKQLAVVGGDSLCFAIAAASILAKEARDDYMKEQDRLFPGYNFGKHVGYGTSAHMASINSLGITALHRRNFGPIAKLVAADG